MSSDLTASGHDYGKPADGFHRRTTSLEAVTGDLGTTETPIDRFFVCSATPPPALSTDGWAMTIDGDAIDAPITIDFARLTALPQVTTTAWLECAGNGRSMFTLVDGHQIPVENVHTSWMLNAMGLARWQGPKLSDVLALAGVTDRAAYVSPVGLDDDNPEGEPARMCLPIAKAMDDATIVATHMNGLPLVPAHGAPARLLVPGWVGAYSVKWLGGLTVSSRWVPSWRADTYYVHRTPDDVITGPVTAHPVKSSLALPYPATLDPGRQELVGYARSGEGPITGVQWSIDGGPWQQATLDKPAGPHAWTVFRFEVDLSSGEHDVRTRATDSSGAVQPEQQPFHPHGVLWQSVIPHPVNVSP